MYYAVAEANEYLAVTGWGISDVLILKKGFIWPGQKVCKFSITPESYSLDLNAMTLEKLECNLNYNCSSNAGSFYYWPGR
jgi:flotillin